METVCMASIFQNAKGILLIDYIEKSQTVNGDYYANLFGQLNDKRVGLANKIMHALTCELFLW